MGVKRGPALGLERAGSLSWLEGEQLLKLRLGEVTPAAASGNPEEARGSSKIYQQQLRLAEVTPAEFLSPQARDLGRQPLSGTSQETPLRSPSDAHIWSLGQTQTKEDRTLPCPHVWPRTTRPGQR